MSRSRLSDARVDELFEARASPIARVDWNATGAYPVLAPTPGAAWPPFVLGDGVYYANMEVPVSCMETEIIAGKNAALSSLLIESVAVHRLVLRLVQTPAWPLLARPVSFRAGSKGFRRCQGTAPPAAALKLATAPAACLAWRPN